MSYVDDDDIVEIDWGPPTEDGGLSLTYSILIKAKNGQWL
jgi:hypothetical protein